MAEKECPLTLGPFIRECSVRDGSLQGFNYHVYRNRTMWFNWTILY